MHGGVKNWNHLTSMFAAEVERSYTLCSSFQHSFCKRVFFHQLFNAVILHFCAFCQWSCCLKWPLRVAQKCCLEFLRTIRLGCVFWKKRHVVRWIQAWVIVLLVWSSILMKQQYAISGESKRKFTDLYIRMLQKNVKIIFIVSDEAIENWLHLWLYEMITDIISIVDSTVWV